jgi:hypothetical protein
VGSREDVGGQGWQGDLYAVVVYQGVLCPADLAAARSYLAAEWGISVASNATDAGCVTADASASTDAGGGVSDATSDGGSDVSGGNPETSPVTFSGTISGTMPSGDSYIFYRLDVAVDIPQGGGSENETGSFSLLTSNGQPVTALPATYSASFSFAGYTGAGVSLEVGFASSPSAFELVGDVAVPCGCLEGNCEAPPYYYGWGGPAITTTSVTCNLNTADASAE